ncbi:hypothetical protein FACS1894167_11000 [Synergistales bacterium]|nr:hypothetical protein FACS1894167_11000 [Synergistales bacterium]
MAMIRCDQGHFYDNEKHSICPWCGVPNMDLPSSSIGDNLEKTVKLSGNASDTGGTIKLEENAHPKLQEGHTIAITKKKLGMDPVVGWLVCVEGAEKGKDYRVHTEKNTVGRADNMDIVMKDSAISRENHAYIVFNPKNKTFRIQAGDGRGLIYVNGDEVIVSQDIVSHDVIEMGESKFRFVPFCGDKFAWEEGAAGGDKA